MTNLFANIRYALRQFRMSPVFTVAAMLTLALGIGGNTTTFTVIHSVLLKPLAYRDPDRVVQISGGSTSVRHSRHIVPHSLCEDGLETP